MNKPFNAEIHVLDRFVHMLNEKSVQYLAEGDNEFNDYIQELQESIWLKRSRLENGSV